MGGPRDAYQYINSTGQIALTGTAAQIIGVNTSRGGVMIANTSATTAVYLGQSNVTATNGHFLGPGASVSIPTAAAIYGVTAGTTITVSFLEVQ